MNIACEVIMGEIDVNQWLREHGRAPVHAKLDDDAPVTERSDVSVALLGEHSGGIANVILVVPDSGNDDKVRLVRVSLALLENICVAMRAEVGEDPREDFVTEGG